jgi:Tol biopolymer transport system component
MGATGESVRRLTNFGFNPSWSPDGTAIVLASESVLDDPNSRVGNSTLSIVKVASGKVDRIQIRGKHSVDGEERTDAVQPQWSPHGYRISYWGISRDQRDIWTVRQDGSDPVRVTENSSGITNWSPVWSPDGKHIYFSSDSGGISNVWRIAIDERSGRTSGSPQPVTSAGGINQRQHVSISKDGRVIGYVEQVVVHNLMSAPISSLDEVTEQPRRLIQSSKSVRSPDPSPDGRFVAYASWVQQEDIYVIRSDGTAERQLTNDLYRDRIPRWSPDGGRIAFYSDRSGSFQVWTIKPDGSGLQQVTHDGSKSITRSVWSPDGRRLAGFRSDEGSFIIELDEAFNEISRRGLPPYPDPKNNFNVWSWSPDGKWLAGHVRHKETAEVKGIAVYSIENGQYELLQDFGSVPTWLNDSRRLLFVNNNKIEFIDRLTKVVSPILSVPLPQYISSLGQLSKDNDRIYFTIQPREADVWLMMQEVERKSTP